MESLASLRIFGRQPPLTSVVILLLLAGCTSPSEPPVNDQPPSTAPTTSAPDGPQVDPAPERNASALPVNYTFTGSLVGAGFDNVTPVGVAGCFMTGVDIFEYVSFDVPSNATALHLDLTWDAPAILYLEIIPAFGSPYWVHDDAGALASNQLTHDVDAPNAGPWTVAVCAQGAANTSHELVARVT